MPERPRPRPAGAPLAARAASGGVVVVCGPDGSGKTTVCDLLASEVLTGTVRMLAAKRGMRRAGGLPRRAARGRTDRPHRAAPYGTPMSVAKLAYLWLDALLGWFLHVRPAARARGWVVIERGWLDHAVDPLRYRLAPAAAPVARALNRVLPRPDLVLVCEAPANVVVARKDELAAEEIVRQSHAWRAALPRAQRRAFVDTSASPGDTVAALAAAVGAAIPPRRPGRREPRVRAVRDRSETWLPLLRALRVAAPEAAVWKNADQALAGIGDVDLAAARRSWDAIEVAFGSWASAMALEPVIACRHMPYGMFLIALEPGGALLQLDVRDRVTFAGATIFTADTVAPLAVDDERGFRTLPPGVEGSLKLFANGSSRGGGPRPDRLERERVRALLRQDVAGARACAALLGPGAAAAIRAASAGGWNRLAVARVLARSLLRSAADPAGLARHVGARAASGCDVAGPGRALATSDVDAWLVRVRRTHMVHGGSP